MASSPEARAEGQPQERIFYNLLEKNQVSKDTLLCIGLDPDINKIPRLFKEGRKDKGEILRDFNKAIIDVTFDLVCAYKPNIAFYEEHGNEGLDALKWTIDYIKNQYKDIPIILDAKRADIGNTNLHYARMAFDLFGVDAITVNPWLGGGALQPFLVHKDKGIIVICQTSNKGAKDFQDDKIYLKDLPEKTNKFFLNLKGIVGGIEYASNPREIRDNGYIRDYQKVAYKAVMEWNKNNNISLVVGATYPEKIAEVRRIVGPNMILLIPGLGDQEGQLESISLGCNPAKRGVIASISRGIIFTKPQKGETLSEAVRRKTMKWRSAINVYRK